MAHHEQQNNITILAIIALVCVALVVGSQWFKHHQEQPAVVAVQQPVTHEVVAQHAVVPLRVSKVVRVAEPATVYESEYEPRRAERKSPINLQLQFGYHKTVAPQVYAGNDGSRYQAQSNPRCCKQKNRSQQASCPDRSQRRSQNYGWSSEHQNVVILMNQFVENVLDNRTLSAQENIDQAKNIVRSLQRSGNLQAVNNNGVTLYHIVQDVVGMVSAQLPAHMQRSLNELFSLLR